MGRVSCSNTRTRWTRFPNHDGTNKCPNRTGKNDPSSPGVGMSRSSSSGLLSSQSFSEWTSELVRRGKGSSRKNLAAVYAKASLTTSDRRAPFTSRRSAETPKTDGNSLPQELQNLSFIQEEENEWHIARFREV